MTTHINGIVQVTRQLHGKTDAEYDGLMAKRYELVLTAIKDGVEPDLITWAIGINDDPSKVQMQKAIAQAFAAEAQAEELVLA
jgi:hypothetical protein